MDESQLVTDLTVTLSAVVGLLVVRWQIDPASGGVAGRFRFALLVVAVFYFVRAADWLTDFGLFRTATFVAAAVIPFAALLLTEGFLRRHAPRFVKLVVAAGMIATGCAAVLLPGSVASSPGFLLLLAAYQLMSFTLIFVMLLTRDRSSLTATENTAINRFAIAIPIVMILLLSDYDLLPPENLPYLSGLGALTIAWVTVTLEARIASAARVFSAVASIAFIGCLAAWLVKLQTGLSPEETLETSAIVVSLMLVLVLGLSSAAIRRDRRQTSLLAAMRHAKRLDDYLAALDNNGLTAGYTILRTNELQDYDGDLMVQVLKPTGSHNMSDLPKNRSLDTAAQSQIRELIARTGGNEVLLVAEEPLMVAVGSPAGFSATSSSSLRSAFGFARVIAERDMVRRGTS
ncbi:hypothetical protein IWQ55_000563 [Labrenzia sp. EL_208]|uniref:hypothetical protein n=1 Tax=Roseibium album TaxID=311410 RepID=UPI0018C99EA7|nr:hypothetical protein [Labrenzia sp. EL_132]MBG6227371.1 hypothetical protein [Labrenzia sp. EL_208]